jgi:hypothetical protein
LRAIVATPIDADGNSLAGASEAALESEFAALDQTTFGSSRGSAIGIINCPTSYEVSFVGSDLEALSAEIDSFIFQQYNKTNIPTNTTITLQFSDGTKATFIKVKYDSTARWHGRDSHGTRTCRLNLLITTAI